MDCIQKYRRIVRSRKFSERTNTIELIDSVLERFFISLFWANSDLKAREEI